MSTTSLETGGSEAAAAKTQGTGRRWAVPFKILVSLGLLAVIGHSVDISTVAALLLDLPLWAGLAAVAGMAGVTLASALRWWLILRAIDTSLPLRRATALMFIGSFFSQVLPTSVGGDAVRVWQATREGLPLRRAFIGVTLERISGLIAVVLMVTGGVLWLDNAIEPMALRLLLLASLPALLAGLTLLCLLDRLPAGLAARLRRLPLLGTVLDLFAAMAVDSRRVLLSGPLSFNLLLLSAAAQIFSVLTVLALAQGFGLALTSVEALAVVPAIILITFIPLSFAGWGVREGASVILLGFVGVSADHALAISVLFGLALLTATLPGCLLWLKGGRRLPPATIPT